MRANYLIPNMIANIILFSFQNSEGKQYMESFEEILALYSEYKGVEIVEANACIDRFYLKLVYHNLWDI